MYFHDKIISNFFMSHVIMSLQEQIDNINKKTLNIDEYNALLSLCVSNFEMAALVFVYDHMVEKKIKPNEKTFNIINKLHSKTIKENSNIILPLNHKKQLQPRRRIHKIMKGKLVSEEYSKIKQLEPEIKEIIKNYNYDGNKIKLAKFISENTNYDMKFSKLIVTFLKRNRLINEIDNSYHLEI